MHCQINIGKKRLEFDAFALGDGPTPRMQVTGNSIDIPSGSTTVSSGNLTDYGTRSLNSTLERTFSVRNPSALGAAAQLSLSGNPRAVISGPGAAMFAVTIQPAALIGVNGSTTLRIRYRPTAAGCHEATISIISNDPARSTYTFKIRGNTTGSPCAPMLSPAPTQEEFSVTDEFEIAISAEEDDLQTISREPDNEVSEMMLYPNPATDRVLMETPASTESRTISFINMHGVTVYSFETTGGLHITDLADFAPGVYIVVSSDRNLAPKRLIKL